MKPIVILTDSRRLSVCRSCGAPVEWAIVAASDKSMPFDRPIVLLPWLDATRDYASVDMAKTTSHFATCPHASRWRKQTR